MLTILIVETDAAKRGQLSKELSVISPKWKVKTASLLSEAREVVQAQRIDVFLVSRVLSDGSGDELFTVAKERFPHALRIQMSEKTDPSGGDGAFDLVHLNVVQPIAAKELSLIVKQMVLTQMRIRKPGVAKLVNDTSNFHVSSDSLQQLLSRTNSPNVEIPEIAEIITQHPTIVASLLHLANSAFYGVPGQIETVEDSLGLLGVEVVRNLAVTELTKKQLRLSPGLQEIANSVLSHSQKVSQIAIGLRRLVDKPAQARLASSTALLHDLGKLLILAAKGNRYADLMGESVDSGVPLWKLEEANFGYDHGAVGGYLFHSLGLPESIVRAVAWHHQPSRVFEGKDCPVAILHIANSLDHLQRDTPNYCGGAIDEDLLSKMNLTMGDLIAADPTR